MAAGVNVIFHPAPSLAEEPLKGLDSFLIALVVIQFPAVVKLLPGFQFCALFELFKFASSSPGRKGAVSGG